MLLKKKKVLVAAGVAAIAMLAVAAIANGELFDGDSERPTVKSIGELAVFKTGGTPSKAQVGALADMAAESPAELRISKLDVPSARAVVVEGAHLEAFVAKTKDGGICTLTPGVMGGLDSSCASLEEFNETGLLSVNLGPGGELVATTVQPLGVATTVSSSRHSTSRSVDGGPFATVLQPGEVIRSGQNAISADAVLKQMKAVSDEVKARTE